MRHLVYIYLLLIACQGSHSTHEMVEFTEEKPISYEFITENLEEGNLNTDLGQLFVVAENYPDLKANENFLQLQQQVS